MNHYDINSVSVKETGPAPLTLDYAKSDDAVEIDRGIRETIKGIRFSNMVIGLALAKIKLRKFYTDLGFKTMPQYLHRLCDDLKMDKSSIYNWLYIGEAYIKHQSELEQVDFNEHDGPTKLPYLERALKTNEKQIVFKNIKNMSLREFISFAKAKEETAISPGDDKPVVTVRGNNIYVDGVLAIIISKKLEKRTSAYFKKVLRVACTALEEGEVIQPVQLHNSREAKRFAYAAERLKMRMRAKKLRA